MPLREPHYAGEIRDSDPNYPELDGYEVEVGGIVAVLSKEVPAELAQLENRLQTVCARLDAVIAVGRLPSADEALLAVLAACANTHGEWVRIHPFANGNGRTARLWATWLGMRYGLPPFIEIKPRPAGQTYAAAAATATQGNHQLCFVVFTQMLQAKLDRQ